MCMNKQKINEKWTNKRISTSDVIVYLKENNFNWISNPENFTIGSVRAFLQKNYGGEGDCTLTSILTVVKYYKPELDTNKVYDYIEEIAKKYLYHEIRGTFPGFNKAIVKNVFNHFGIQKQLYSKYIKGIGFNQKTIINELKQNIPVIISLTNDGRNYYKHHTITIVGYMIFKDKDNKEKTLFKVYDNWFTGYSILDYDVLNADCMICY